MLSRCEEELGASVVGVECARGKRQQTGQRMQPRTDGTGHCSLPHSEPPCS